MPFFKRKSERSTPSSPKVDRDRSVRLSSSSHEGHSPDLPNGLAGRVGEGASWEMGPARTPTRPKVLVLHPNQDTLRHGLHVDTPLQPSSRLSKTLAEVLHDKEALPYFIHFMENHGTSHLIRFWLDAESFQAAAWSRLQSQTLSVLSPDNDLSLDSVLQPQTSTSTGPTSPADTHGNSPANPCGGGVVDAYQCQVQAIQGQTRSKSSDSRTVEAHGHQISSVCPVGENQRAQSSPSNLQRGVDSGSTGDYVQSALTSSSRISSPDGNIHSSRTEPGSSSHVPAASTNNHTSANQSASSLQQLNQSGVGAKTAVCVSASSCQGNGDVTKQSEEDMNTCAHHGASSESNRSNHQQPSSATLGGSVTHSPEGEAQGEARTSPPRQMSQEAIQEKLKKSIERDAVAIYTKYIAKDASHPIGISDRLRDETITKICGEGGHVDPRCFEDCQQFVVHLMDQQHYSTFGQSEFHCKHQIDLLTKATINVADILYNENALGYLTEYLEAEGGLPLLQCCLDLDAFQQHLSDQQGRYDGIQAQTDAMVIYDKYFSLQASNPLGFDDAIRFEVESNICREEGPRPDCFVKAKRLVLRTIDKVYFPAFLQSEVYFKYLSDLISSVQSAAAMDVPQYKRSRRGSDASSEHSMGSHSTGSDTHSLGTRNTLLATDTSGFHIKKALRKINADMSIDTSLFNPDSLWQRPQSGKMSFGKVDTLGQFISEAEAEPDRHDTGLAGFFTKRKEKDKSQEDMAIQIAQMILNDVAMVTSQHNTPKTGSPVEDNTVPS